MLFTVKFRQKRTTTRRTLQKKRYVLKILIIGAGGVGKTTLLRRFVEGIFTTDIKMTIGVEFFTKDMQVENYECSLQLWDFGGQERFRFLLDSYILGVKGTLLMFDLTRIATLDPIKEWVDLLRKNNPELPILLVGAKKDLEEKTSVDDNYVLQLNVTFHFIDYVKISSKTGENVNSAFEILLRNILKID